MKKLFLLLLAITISLLAFSQENSINVKNYQLENGLKVILCKDSQKPEIIGAVAVNVGSIHDPEDATGMAHYFEHIMFKGTDKIGTLNWDEEKIYLDSINYYYDRLHETSDKTARDKIQLKINELSQKAAQYAIPNEIDAILSKMGGKNINAFTSLENTVYLNSFPSNQLYKWLEVYAERFRNPVFRLFQSELETVYEEKNMYQDNPLSIFMEDVLKAAFGEHPYGRPIIGYAEHLKSPQPTKMREFFDTYYVANNMTLILVGDLEFDTTIEIVEQMFGELPSGIIPDYPNYKLAEYKGYTIIEKRQTPIKFGIIGFNSVAINHDDNIALDIITEIFNNDSGTGLLDELMLNNKLMGTYGFQMAMKQHGIFAFMYIPKILGQSHENAEKYIFNCIDAIKKGEFSDELFEAVKTEFITNKTKNIEGYNRIFNMILDYNMAGKPWENYYSDLEKVKSLSKNDIVRVANKYLGDDCLIYRSKMGSPDKDKIDKPNWKAIEIQNTDAESEFARKIDLIKTDDLDSQVIEFGKDVIINKSNPSYTIYSTKNPYNDIFSMRIYYKYGTYYNRHLSNAIDYIELQGTEDIGFQDFNIKLQLLGASIGLNSEDDLSYISITGFDKDFEEIMELCHQKYFNTGNDETILKSLLESHQSNMKLMKKDGSSCAGAAFYYALYGEDSDYLKMPTSSEIKNYSGNELIEYARNVFEYEGFVTYSGNLDSEVIYNTLFKNNFIRENGKKYSDSKTQNNINLVQVEKTFDENEIYYLHNKKFLQSNIHFFVNGIQTKTKDRNKVIGRCFNQYFGGDMYSIVFQEIREFRSLGYAAYSRYRYDFLDRKPSYLYAYLGTQSDKTLEGIDAMYSLITDIPQKPDKYKTAKEALLAGERSNYIDFRSLPYEVYKWVMEGYNEDPRKGFIKIIEDTEFSDVLEFYNKTIKNKPVAISLSGNMKRVNKKELAKFGKLHELKLSDIFCE